jgi:hypothetical protein
MVWSVCKWTCWRCNFGSSSAEVSNKTKDGYAGKVSCCDCSRCLEPAPIRFIAMTSEVLGSNGIRSPTPGDNTDQLYNGVKINTEYTIQYNYTLLSWNRNLGQSNRATYRQSKWTTVRISGESPTGAVRVDSLLVGGLQGCYWWETVWRTLACQSYIYM